MEENYTINSNKLIAFGKDPENEKAVKGDEDTFSTKFTDKLRNSMLNQVFGWYDENVLGIEPNRGKG